MKFLLQCALLTALVTAFSGAASAQNTQNFSISNFDSNYLLTKNEAGVSQLAVDEYITAQFPNFNQNRGILRAIPQNYNNNDINLKIVRVDKATDRQSPTANTWLYTTSTQNNNLVLKIGDPNTYVQGAQSFHIAYSMQNVIKAYDDQDELYWDVNGTEWQQTANIVTANVNLPADIAGELGKFACYTGAQGSTQKDCEISKIINPDNSAKIVVTANSALAPGQNLSFVLGFSPGTFTIAKPTIWQVIQPYLPFAVALAIGTFTLLFVIRQWRKYGRDPKGRGTIIAEYSPPKNRSVLVNDYVLQESGRQIAISAQLINLAIRGYVRIIDNGDDKKQTFSLELTKAYSDLADEEKDVITMFFGDKAVVGKIVKIKDLENKLSTDVTKLGTKLATSVTVAGYFRSNPTKATGKYIGYGIAVLVAGFFIALWGRQAGIGGGLVLSGVILLIVAKRMPARTAEGVKLHDYLLGLKLYIGMAEQERIRFHQSPETAERKRIDVNNPKQMLKLFEDLLPYAMLFGMEKQWGKEFEGLYTTPPDWYGGNISAFSTGYLLGSLGSFNSASTASFSAPSSSGSSGFGGGGGFSGGGGGGGGGGGW